VQKRLLMNPMSYSEARFCAKFSYDLWKVEILTKLSLKSYKFGSTQAVAEKIRSSYMLELVVVTALKALVDTK